MEKFNYDFHKTRKPEDYLVYLKRFRDNPRKILEMGSGIGLFLQLCVKEGIDVIGLEYDAEGVDFCTKIGLTVIQHDLGNPIPFESNIFDAVFSNQVIEHLLPDAQINMINESFRVLKPGGQALIISPCRHFEPARMDKYHIGLLTPSEIKQMAEKAGFMKINMGYNRCQPVPPIPYDLISALFKAFNTPDLLSQDATVHCYKPL